MGICTSYQYFIPPSFALKITAIDARIQWNSTLKIIGLRFYFIATKLSHFRSQQIVPLWRTTFVTARAWTGVRAHLFDILHRGWHTFATHWIRRRRTWNTRACSRLSSLEQSTRSCAHARRDQATPWATTSWRWRLSHKIPSRTPRPSKFFSNLGPYFNLQHRISIC